MTLQLDHRTTSTENPVGALSWRHVHAIGVATFVASALFIQTVLATEVIPPLVVLSVLHTAVFLLLPRKPRALTVVAAVLGIASILGEIPFIVQDLGSPAGSPLAFATMTLVLTALALVIRSGIAQRRATSPARVQRALAVAGAVVLVGAVIAGVASTTSSSDEVLDGDVAVEMEDIEFQPGDVVVASGGAVAVRNADLVNHTFSVRDTDVDLEVPAGRTRRTVVDLAPGEYELYCAITGHENMDGTLVVE